MKQNGNNFKTTVVRCKSHAHTLVRLMYGHTSAEVPKYNDNKTSKTRKDKKYFFIFNSKKF